MLTHDDIRLFFFSVFPEGQPGGGVAMVSRYLNSGLQLPGGRAHIFIPDCHLLTTDDANCYPKYHFQLKDDLELFLKGLKDLKISNRGEVTVWSLGDLFDLWRARGNLGDKGELDAITAEYAPIMDLLLTSPPNGVRAELIAGNHDYAIHLLPEWSARRFALIENQPGKGDLLILHGDTLDAIEKIPLGLKELGVKVATWISAGQHELDQEDQQRMGVVNRNLADGDTMIGAGKVRLYTAGGDTEGDEVNVVSPDRPGTKPESKQYYEAARELALALKSHGHDVRTVIVGHSHFARIVAGDRGDGIPFSLMDCGAWFGQCRLSSKGPWILSAQVGVLVGSDMRIYQLGTRPAV